MFSTLALLVEVVEVRRTVDLFPHHFRVVPADPVHLPRVVLKVKMHLVAMGVVVVCSRFSVDPTPFLVAVVWTVVDDEEDVRTVVGRGSSFAGNVTSCRCQLDAGATLDSTPGRAGTVRPPLRGGGGDELVEVPTERSVSPRTTAARTSVAVIEASGAAARLSVVLSHAMGIWFALLLCLQQRG